VLELERKEEKKKNELNVEHSSEKRDVRRGRGKGGLWQRDNE